MVMTGVVRVPRRWGRKPEKPKARRVADIYDQMQREIARLKPELVAEWKALETVPSDEVRDWLDKNFPVPGGWALRAVHQSPKVLKQWTPPPPPPPSPVPEPLPVPEPETGPPGSTP